MDSIYIETSQNINIEHESASISERIVSHIIDYSFFLIYFFGILILNGIFKINNSFMMFLFYLPILFYDLIFEISSNGQNLGKRIMKIKVVKINGTEPTFIDYFIRWIFRLIDNVLFFGSVSVITILVNGKGQRLGDIAAGTCIVRIKRTKGINDLLYTEVPENYKISYPEVEKLSTQDIYTIKEVLDFYHSDKNWSMATKMAEKTQYIIKNKLNIQSNLNAIDLLIILLLDYNAVHKSKQN